MQRTNFYVRCPTWALPREEIPIHIEINKDITKYLKNIKINLIDDFELIDIINIANHEVKDNTIIINEIGKAKKSDFDYFGIVVATKKLPSELKKEIPINIEFEYHNGTKENMIQNARIFRPLLSFESIPEDITISDNDESLPKIPIRLKFIGFGDISLRTECKIEGEIVSIGTSMLDEVLRRIINEGIVNGDENKNTVKVNQNYVENITAQIREKFRKGENLQQIMKEQQITKDDIESLYELSHKEKEKFMEIFFKTVENYVTKIISDMLSRNPGDNLQLESQTKIHAQIKLPSTNVTIKFFYKDLLGNEYEPIEKVVQINDKRKNPSNFDVEIPLEIKDVDETKAYKNVGAMIVGTHS